MKSKLFLIAQMVFHLQNLNVLFDLLTDGPSWSAPIDRPQIGLEHDRHWGTNGRCHHCYDTFVEYFL